MENTDTPKYLDVTLDRALNYNNNNNNVNDNNYCFNNNTVYSKSNIQTSSIDCTYKPIK